MDVQVIDHLKHEDVSLKPGVARSGDFLQVAKNNTLVASEKRRGSTATFKEITAVGENVVDGQMDCYVALQVGNESFLTPKKPKDNKSTTLKVILKKVNPSKLFDKKNHITKKSLKYWFILNTVGDGMIYESSAYRGFYLSVEGNKVLMRKCPDGLPTDENYHIRVVPAFNKMVDVEVRRHTEIVSVATTERMGNNVESVIEVIEEDTTIKTLQMDDLDNQSGETSLSSDVVADCEPKADVTGPEVIIPRPDDTDPEVTMPIPGETGPEVTIPRPDVTGPEVTIPRPDVTGQEVTMPIPDDSEEGKSKLEEAKETNRKKRSMIGNRTMEGTSVVEKGTVKRRSIMSKLFSCVSSRNTSD